jgi:hypothetical protein
MADEEPENWFVNVSLPRFSREKTTGAPLCCHDGLSDLPS